MKPPNQTGNHIYNLHNTDTNGSVDFDEEEIINSHDEQIDRTITIAISTRQSLNKTAGQLIKDIILELMTATRTIVLDQSV
jgi:hypothetical protein